MLKCGTRRTTRRNSTPLVLLETNLKSTCDDFVFSHREASRSRLEFLRHPEHRRTHRVHPPAFSAALKASTSGTFGKLGPFSQSTCRSDPQMREGLPVKRELKPRNTTIPPNPKKTEDSSLLKAKGAKKTKAQNASSRSCIARAACWFRSSNVWTCTAQTFRWLGKN